jgi:hypothetical protein
VLAEVDWSSIQVAGAFGLGAVLGTIATIRIFRYVLDYLKRRDGP